MSQFDGPDLAHSISIDTTAAQRGSVACLLFESLVHHLIEKGVLTKNDALSVVQTVAEVKRGGLHEGQMPGPDVDAAVAMLHAMYSSFEALTDGPGTVPSDGANVFPLRPPLHGNQPTFPRAD